MLGLAGRAAQACPARTGLTVLKLLLWYVVPCVPANILTCVMTQIAKMFHIHNDPSRPVQLKGSTLRKWVENKADLRSAGKPVKAYRCALTKLSLLLLLLLHPGKPSDSSSSSHVGGRIGVLNNDNASQSYTQQTQKVRTHPPTHPPTHSPTHARCRRATEPFSTRREGNLGQMARIPRHWSARGCCEDCTTKDPRLCEPDCRLRLRLRLRLSMNPTNLV